MALTMPRQVSTLSADTFTVELETITPTRPTSSSSNDHTRDNSRKRLRETVTKPLKRRKVAKPVDNVNVSDDHASLIEAWKPIVRKIDHEAKWLYFLTFSNTGADDLTMAILGEDSDVFSAQFQTIREKVKNKIKQWKNAMLKRCEKHVREMQALDNGPDGDHNLELLESTQTITSFFHRRFSKESFFEIFFFAADIFDYDTSSKLGQWYCKTIYSNLCMRVYGHVQRKDQVLRSATENSQDDLLAFVDTMVAHEAFDGVTRDKFHEKRPTIGRKEKKEGEGKALPVDGQRFHILDPAPEDDE